jgi:hypothetical protein
MKEMIERRRWRSAARRARVALAVIAMACGKAAGPSSSSSSHWLVCELDADCTSAGSEARCASDGYCVDVEGVRVTLTGTGPLGAPDDGDGPEGGSSCNCADVEAGTARVSLECYCQSADCAVTPDTLLDSMCDQEFAPPLVRYQGCGSIVIEGVGAIGGSTWVYDEATGELVGFAQFTDTEFWPCSTSQVIAGREFECETATRCHLCGPNLNQTIPPCE